MIDRLLIIKWVRRCLDPESEQATGMLRDPENPEKMCCLGHLCDVSEMGEWKVEGGNYFFRVFSGVKQTGVLPYPLADRVNLSAAGAKEGGWEIGSGLFSSLSIANDDGKTLAEIGRAIQEHYGITEEELGLD